MRIVIKRVGQEAEVKEIPNELHAFQEIVGGYIECIRIPGNIICVCNEEGKLMGLPPNFIYESDIIVGDVFFVADGGEDFESLDDEQIGFLLAIMHVFGN